MKGIEASGLVKRYGNLTAVNGLDLCVEQGQLYALLGMNGAGKTTAIRMLCGLTEADGGDARIMGCSVRTDLPGVRSLTAISPQESAVAPKLTVAENLMMIAQIHGMKKSEAREKCGKIIRQMELESVEKRYAGKLSGGWQRRLSIAMALVSQPKVLFLDEPTLGMDVLSRRSLWQLIRGLRGEMTILLTTHYMEEAAYLSDCIGILRAGRLVAQGTAEELMKTAGAESFEDAFVALAVAEEGVK